MKKDEKNKTQWFYILETEGLVFLEKQYVELEEYIWDIVSVDNKHGVENKCEQYFWDNVDFELTTYNKLKEKKYKFWR